MTESLIKSKERVAEHGEVFTADREVNAMLDLVKDETERIDSTFLEEYRKQMEPGAAPYTERLAALKALHDAGCKTWVSIEPYPTPNMIEQDLNEILEAVVFTDRIIFGRTNYSKVANAFVNHRHFYNECAKTVIAFCEDKGIAYHIKNKTITEE